ncbi:MAG: LOG family protein [Maribacter sp.]
MLKHAALFGGSGNNTESKEYLETIRIGSFLAKQGYIVKNGGYGGMMEAVSKGAVQSGGKSIGVTCKQVGSSDGNKYLSETIVTEKLFDRLKILLEGTSVFIVQRGGIGTLSEVFLTLDIIRKEPKEERPKLYFIGAIWKDLIVSLKANLIPNYEHDLFQIVENFQELRERMLMDF